MRRIIYLTCLALFLPALFTNCKKEYTDQELFDTCSSGVVLILNQYYYETTLPDGGKVYFSEFDGETLQNMTFEEEEIIKNRSISFGTGFFVSNTGEILTNRHVAAPSIDNSEVKGKIKDFYSAFTDLIEYLQEELSNEFDLLESQKADCYYVDYFGDICCNRAQLAEIERKQEELRSQYQENIQTIQGLKGADFSELSTRCISELSIAYNNTFVTNASDFKPCVFIRSSEDDQTDLALIQLKDKITPESSHVFVLPEMSDSENETLNINEHVVMISYNAGIQLSNTAIGIQAQLNTGNVSQKGDGVKVMYSIPSLKGSSGSPVLNKYGELVAVNFAGLTGTQSFNYGIVTERIRKFLNY
jgi:hypothetical protein